MADRSATFRLKTESDASGVDELSQAMKRAEAATKKLSDPNLTPRQLQRAVLDLDIATENVATAMKKVQSTGGPVTPEMATKAKALNTELSTATTRLGQMIDRQGDLRVRANLSAQSMETLSGRVGSLQGALGLAADASTGMVGSLAKLGLGLFAAAEAIKVLDQGAKQIVAGSQALGDSFVAMAERSAKASTELSNQTAITRALDTGMLKTGGTARDLGQEFAALVSHVNRAAKELQDFATGAAVKIPESFFKVQQAAAGLNTTLALAFQKSKAEFLDWADVNKSRLQNIEGEYLRHGQKVPEYIDKALRALQREGVELDLLNKKIYDQKHALDDLVKSKAAEQTANYKVADSIKAVVTEAAKAIASAQDSIASAHRTAEEKIRALKQEEISQEEFNARKRVILKEMDAAVAASAAEESAANMKAEEANRALATQYGLTSEQMKKALQDAKNLADGTNAARDADEGLKGMAEKLAEAMAAQEKTWGPNKTESEKWALAINEVAKKTVPAVTATVEFSDAFFKIGEDAPNVAKQTGSAAIAFEDLGKKAAGSIQSVKDLAAAMRDLAQASYDASGGKSDMGGDITGGPLGGGGSDTVPSH